MLGFYADKVPMCSTYGGKKNGQYFGDYTFECILLKLLLRGVFDKI